MDQAIIKAKHDQWDKVKRVYHKSGKSMTAGDVDADLEGSTTSSEAADLEQQEAWDAGIAYMKYMDPIFTNSVMAISKLTSI